MVIVTAVSPEGERDGCLVGFETQCSIHPPRFLVCISKQNRTFDVVTTADTVVVHFLGKAQRNLAELFGGETGDDVDKFELTDWRDGPGGAPILTEAPGWFAGRVLNRFDLGDHMGLWLEPFEAEDRGGALDLGFQNAKDIHPGHPA